MKIPKIKLDVRKLWRAARVFEAEKRPQILAGMGVAGFWGAMWWTYKNAPKIDEAIDFYKEAIKEHCTDNPKADEEHRKGVKKQVAVDICKNSAGPVLLGVASSAAVIGSTSISSQRIAALSAVCTATQSTLDAYREKIRNGTLGEFGEQKDQKVMNELAKDTLKKTGGNADNTPVYVTGKGDTLCLDKWTGRYFLSSPEAIKRAFNEISYQCQMDDYVSLNELYDHLELPEIKMGEVLGWTTDNRRKGIVDISFTACVNDHEQPVLVLQYEVEVLPYYRGQARIGPND